MCLVLSAAAFCKNSRAAVIVTETMWLTKPKIFNIRYFIESPLTPALNYKVARLMKLTSRWQTHVHIIPKYSGSLLVVREDRTGWVA